MNTIKSHRFFKAICIALIATFISLDISYAYPSEYTARNSTLATPSVFQTQPITTHAEAFQRSMLADGNLLGTACSIAKFLLEDGIKLRYLARVLGEELGDASKYVDLSRVSVTIMYDGRLVKLDPSLSVDTPQSAVVLIPYNKDGKKGIIEIALKRNLSIDKLAGYQWVVSDKYVIKDLPADYKEPISQPVPEVKAKAPVQPTISEPIAQVETLLTKKEKDAGVTSKGLNIRAIILPSLLIALFPLGAFAGTTDIGNEFTASYSANPFAAIFGIAALGSALSAAKDFFLANLTAIIEIVLIGTVVELILSVWWSAWFVSWHLFWARVTKNKIAHVNELVKTGAPAIPYLIKALESSNSNVRWLAVYVLGKIGPVTDKVVSALVKKLGDRDGNVRSIAAGALITINDGRLLPMYDYLMTMITPGGHDKYYEVLKPEEINYILECLDNNVSIEGQYVPSGPYILKAQLNVPAVPSVKGAEQGLGAAELKDKWSEKMKSAKEIGIQVNLGQLDEITDTKKEINGIEYFESNTHNMKVSGDNRWHRGDAVACSFDAAEFNFTKLYEDVKPRHLIDEIKLENDDWYIGMDYMPILKYHMIIAPKQARQQLATRKDLVDMQQLLAQMGDEKATLLHNSLLAGAGINSLHYHLFFYDFPIFKEGFPIYKGTEKFSTKIFTGKNCTQEAGSYLEELQGANQPYNSIMRYGKIIIIPRPRDIEFGYGADALAGVVLYGNDRSLEAATWYKPEPAKTSDASRLFEIVESSLNSRMSQFIEAGDSLINLANTRRVPKGFSSIGNINQKMTTAGIVQRVEWAIEALDKEGVAPEIKTATESLKKDINQFEADSTVASLIVLARRAKREDQKLIIGLETDWIPGMNIKDSWQKQAIFALMKEIDSIGDALKSMGLDNVEIIRGSGKDLADTLLDKAGKTHTNLHNIVVMASSNTINSENFAKLRDADENDRPFLAGIDPKELIKFYSEYGESTSNQLYIKLTQLLHMTLELASGKELMYIPMLYCYDRAKRIVIFMPIAELKDYEALKNTYAAEKTALMAA